MQPGLASTPYCGTAPAPGGVAWNLDPMLGAALLAGLLLAWRLAGASGDRRWLAVGWIVLASTLISPLCNLSVALFSARVAQHLVLLAVAAPMLALALPIYRHGPAGMAAAAAAFAAALWAWHLPGPYALTFRSDIAYWAMQGSLVATATWLWHGLLLGAARRPEVAILAGLATAAQMGALGALLTFTPRPLFVPHALSTLPWGLTPLEDQQLGGLLMWVPGGLAFALLALSALARALRAEPAAR
ncbi:cytochrome c oxidase assembly protein [Falsiroseomonas oryzae]|uniref:cytochrome c oxidase assembly protein n=1 Tax=Falsiroseomonas oryzae TaxID=2766473 RepID=UPI0022EA964C|nr:cytochrome c oxidase assembly protein [Roseomonas sp. MO-31]